MSDYLEPSLEEEFEKGVVPAIKSLTYALERLSRHADRGPQLRVVFESGAGGQPEPVRATVSVTCSFGSTICDPIFKIVGEGHQCERVGDTLKCVY